MKFVVIVEPDEVHASRIRAILEGIDKDFEYVLVDSAEEGIDEVENRETDVFIGSMEMPVLSGTELFGVIEMISPETVRIVMTESNKIMETVSFMNECRTFKVIIKPCQVADDLIAPINAAITYKELHREDNAVQATEMKVSSMEQEYQRLKEIQRRGMEHYERAAAIFSEMIACNLALGDRPPEVQRRLAAWYRWMIEEYEALTITGGPGYEAGVRKVMERYHIPAELCTVQIRREAAGRIGPGQMSCLFYLLHLLLELCRRILFHYQISVSIEPAQNAQVLKFRCEVRRADDGIVYRENNPTMRAEMIRAVEKGMEALADRIRILPGEDSLSIGIAVIR